MNIETPEFDDYAIEDIDNETFILVKIIKYNIENDINVDLSVGHPLKSGIYKDQRSLYYKYKDNDYYSRVGILNDTISPNNYLFFNDNKNMIKNDYLKK